MSKSFLTLDDVDVAGKRVLLRIDLNIPMEKGRVADPTRIDRAAPTILELANKGAKVILLSHFGRPKGGPDRENSLEPLVAPLSERLGRPVAFAADCIGSKAAAAVAALRDGEILLLENTRFHAGEEKNDPQFAKDLASDGDIFVNDAFSAAHRAHASTEGLAHLLPCYAGRNMQAELEALDRALENPKRPLMAIVGGAKISTKLDLLGNLTKKVDVLTIGGGMANTFLAARGLDVGKSLCERDLLETSRKIMADAAANNCRIVLPSDVVVARDLKANAPHRTIPVDAVGAGEMILDIGERSAAEAEALLEEAATLVWNGPFGAFELKPFDAGTNAVAAAAAKLTRAGKLVSVAGGGDTVSALNASGAGESFTYLSTAGGAFLEWLEGKVLPGVEALKRG